MLYQKHRPGTWDEVIGNESITEALQNLLKKQDEIPHSYLFTGDTGCGKTTIARILANNLGCNGYDYREINSADFRGIDTVREIIKQCQYKPLEGDSKVWVIDECHKLTGDAQNALLKILEDTPNHVYFILCTTDPQKLLGTIKGRCLQFTMSVLSDQQMYRLLRKVVGKEKETLQKEVYDQIIQDSLGHPRNALQILEQVLNVEEERRLETARQKAVEYNEAIELCRILLAQKGSWKSVSGILKGLKEAGQDCENVRRVVLGYCQSILLSGKDDERVGLIMEEMKEPFYNTGFPGLVFACYSIFKN